MRTLLSLVLPTVLVLAPSSISSSGSERSVELVRVPNGGIQPEIAVDAAAVVHMVYLAGEAAAANVFYVRSTDDGKTFSRAMRVNSQRWRGRLSAHMGNQLRKEVESGVPVWSFTAVLARRDGGFTIFY